EGQAHRVSMPRPCARFRPWHDSWRTSVCTAPPNLGQRRGLRTALDRRTRGQRSFASCWARTLLLAFGYLLQVAIKTKLAFPIGERRKTFCAHTINTTTDGHTRPDFRARLCSY